MDQFVPASESELFKPYLSNMVQVTLATDVQISPKLKKAHQDHDFEWFYNQSKMLIPPNLDRIISADVCPPMQAIDELPDALALDNRILRHHNLLYLVVLEKEGEMPRLGIGTAANQHCGAQARVKNYRDEVVYLLSKYTRKSLEEGFKITKLAALVLSPRPKDETARPLLRAWMLTLEASFTWTFWTVWQAKDSDVQKHYMGHASVWADRWYKGLNSHSPLAEDVVSIELSHEELLQRVMEKKERDRLRASKFYYSERGYAYNKAYRNTDERKAYMTQYKQTHRRHLLTVPSHLKLLEERKEGRALVRKVDAGEVDMEEIDQTALAKALKLKDQNLQCKRRLAPKTSKTRRAELDIFNQVKAGELDGQIPEVATKVKRVAKRKEHSRVYKSKNRKSVNAAKRKRYAASVEALEKVEEGLLDGEDPEIKKLCKVATSARERAARQKAK